MKLSSKLLLTVLTLIVAVNSAATFAVSEEETQKITSAVSRLKLTVKPAEPRKILIFNLCQGYKHSAVPYGAKALEIMGEKTGAYTAVSSDDMQMFAPENLNQFDVIVFNNTTRLKFEDPVHRKSLMDFVKSGKGVVGIHAATDNFYNFPEAAEMMGGLFDGHPWGSGGTWSVKIDDPSHPLNAAFNGRGFKIKDEIYRLKAPYGRDKFRVLMSLDMKDKDTKSAKNIRPHDKDIAISLVRSYGKGRVFYGSLGHNHEIFWNQAILQHYLDGIQFAIGDLKADTTPSLDILMAELAEYDYNSSSSVLRKFEEVMYMAYNRADFALLIEDKCIEFLSSEATIPAKQFVCIKLGLIGTEKSVDVLSGMLKDPETSDMARYALERIDSAKSDKVMIASLDGLGDEEKIGTINTLAARGSKEAVDKIYSYTRDPNPEISAAAIVALGRIGDTQCAKHLTRIADQKSSPLRLTAAKALLKCAEKLADQGNTTKALAIYTKLNKTTEPIELRVPAFTGQVTVGGAGSISTVRSALSSSEPRMTQAAIGCVRQVADSEMLKTLASRLESFEPVIQVQLIAAFADKGDAVVLRDVLNASNSADAEVKLAALKAIGHLGDADCVEKLADAAASEKGDHQNAARASLYMLKGSNVDSVIVSQISKSTQPVKIELIKAVGQRRIVSAKDMLMASAKGTDVTIARESARALKPIVTDENFAEMVELMAEIDDSSVTREMEQVVLAAAKSPDKMDAHAAVVTDTIAKIDNVQTKRALLGILPKLGSDKSLEFIKATVNDQSKEVSDAAIRALSSWPNDAAASSLLTIARASKNDTHRKLALYGFLRLVSQDTTRPEAETIKLFKSAATLTTDPKDKSKLLSELSKVKSLRAMNMAMTYTNDPATANEAALAATKIALLITSEHPDEVKAAMKKIIASTDNKTVKSRASNVLNELAKAQDHIVIWQVAGPYGDGKANFKTLHDTPFAPENDPGSVKWESIRLNLDKRYPWKLTFDEALGRLNNRVVYIRTTVTSSEKQKVRFETGSDDCIKMWLNGKVILSKAVARGAGKGSDRTDKYLEEGPNEILVKITNGGSQWAAAVRICDTHGRQLKNLEYVYEF